MKKINFKVEVKAIKLASYAHPLLKSYLYSCFLKFLPKTLFIVTGNQPLSKN